MLKPGDLLVPAEPIYDDKAGVSWETLLVIAVDRGETPANWSRSSWRPASIIVLTASMHIEKRDFSWITRKFKHA